MICADAIRLLRERRQAAAKGNFDRIREIDAERWAHDPATDECCECWQKARAAANQECAA